MYNSKYNQEDKDALIMAQKRYDQDCKVQAVKLAKEISINKADKEIGVAPSTVNGWVKASKEGIFYLGLVLTLLIVLFILQKSLWL